MHKYLVQGMMGEPGLDGLRGDKGEAGQSQVIMGPPGEKCALILRSSFKTLWEVIHSLAYKEIILGEFY